MGFRNPVTTQPFYRFRDEFYWPCVSGEQLAPVFASGAGYSQYLSKPSVNVPGGSGIATWPNIPRVSPINPDQQTLTIKFLFGITSYGTNNGQTWFTYGNSKPSAALRVATANVYTFNVTNAAGSSETITTPVAPSLTAYDEITIVYSAAGVATLTINGTLVAASTKLWLPTDTSDAILAKAQCTNTGGNAHLTQLRFTYA